MHKNPDFLFFPDTYYPQAKSAAVCFFVFKENNQFFLGMILRNKYPGVHSNQVGFPGGKFDKEFDSNLLDACIRETYEELGVKLKEHQIVDVLNDVYIPPSNFKVRPYFVLLESLPKLSLDEREVNKFLKIPLSLFYKKENFKNREIKTNINTTINTASVLFKDYLIWGASLLMIQSFVKKYPHFIENENQ